MKNFKLSKKLVLVLSCLLLVTFPVLAEQTGASIMQKVQEAQASTTSALDIKLTLQEENGSARERRLQTLTSEKDGLTKTLTVFLSPSSVKNTRFLTLENKDGNDDQWIYLPSLGKTKRIAAQEGGGSFMGSDFTYADMASTTYTKDQAVHTLLREEDAGTYHCYVVESVPTISSEYGKTIIWVDQTTFLPIQVEFYKKDETSLLKVLKTEEITKVGNRWMTTTLVMTSLDSQHSTRIEILQAKYDIPLNEGFFTLSFLATGRLS
ncbi:outer membrane lipoprotein-sorting protein [uncultured Sphaerochaeta sp.]|uniref:outer membrane lipoprotein-sorting protein n=1 Tax=uncultured Sphaerochaeta sp. TaxID=886478 RepID=UPI002A0A3AE0|nr:outer membrane lipoprotein-sorting protein [uncultured Sphaerochaeta sp.]